MRVIAGTARGVRLESPADARVRPTLDRVRESLFNILGERVVDSAFLDLFAGTGAMGIEALSRGAKSAVFVDNDPAHLELVRRNLKKARLEAHGQIVRAEIPAGFSGIRGQFDIIYADPPRKFEGFGVLMAEIAARGLLADGGWFMLETGAKVELEDDLDGLKLVDSRTYGKTRVSIFT